MLKYTSLRQKNIQSNGSKLSHSTGSKGETLKMRKNLLKTALKSVHY